MSAANKTAVELEKERRLDPCYNCDTDRSKCEYGCGEENHWSARHSAVEIAAQNIKEGVALQTTNNSVMPCPHHCNGHECFSSALDNCTIEPCTIKRARS